MLPVLRSLWESGILFLQGNAPEKIVRDAFPCSLCTHSVKCRVEIEYYPLGRSDEIRARVTSALKYVENCLRAALSVKSRLATRSLDPSDKALIDAYFENLFRALNEKRRLEHREAYEELYDAPKESMSFSGADTIEQNSWENTWRLVENEAVEAAEPVMPITENIVAVTQEETAPEKEEDHVLRYLEAILSADVMAKKEALRLADVPEETLAEKINEIFFAIIDDVVLEIRDGGAVLIEDYREEVSEWLKMQK